MLKLPVLLAAVTLAGSIAGGAAIVQPEITYAKAKSSLCSTNKPQKACDKHNIQEILNKKGLTIIIGGNINKPCSGNPNKPGNPGIVKPDKPNKPETGKPETDKPETDNSYATQVVKLVNEERKKAGLSSLTIKTDVTKAANIRAKEIVSSFSHTRPNGSKFTTALTESGVKYRGAGENIAWGQKSPEAVMKGWMNSKGHRDNILNKNYTSIGVGYYKDASGKQYWTQLFTY